MNKGILLTPLPVRFALIRKDMVRPECRSGLDEIKGRDTFSGSTKGVAELFRITRPALVATLSLSITGFQHVGRHQLVIRFTAVNNKAWLYRPAYDLKVSGGHGSVIELVELSIEAIPPSGSFPAHRAYL